MTRIVWRWEERDLGFRFRTGTGARAAEHYQARHQGEFYIVPAAQRKLDPGRIEELSRLLSEPGAVRVVATPWRNYDRDWDWIDTEDGICLNWAGCLEQHEIHRREDEGVQRAMELVNSLITRPAPVPLSIRLIQDIHIALMETIYPFAGSWRTVALHRGDGPTRWPLPPGGIQPLMDVLQRDVLSRSPLQTDQNSAVYAYVSEVMNEIIAIHPFREGNGRTAFLVGNLILMQNDLLPLTTYERRSDEARYYAACEAGRIQKSYAPLAALIAEWEEKALELWRKRHG